MGHIGYQPVVCISAGLLQLSVLPEHIGEMNDVDDFVGPGCLAAGPRFLAGSFQAKRAVA